MEFTHDRGFGQIDSQPGFRTRKTGQNIRLKPVPGMKEGTRTQKSDTCHNLKTKSEINC